MGFFRENCQLKINIAVVIGRLRLNLGPIYFIFTQFCQKLAINRFEPHPVTDLGFPRGGANCLEEVPTYCFAKMHENERIWTEREGGAVSLAPLWIRH